MVKDKEWTVEISVKMLVSDRRSAKRVVELFSKMAKALSGNNVVRTSIIPGNKLPPMPPLPKDFASR